MKSVADNDIGLTGERSRRFNVALKADGQSVKQFVCLLDRLAPLGVLGTVGKQRDSGRRVANAFHVGVTQVRKGDVQLRAAVNVRAAVQKQERVAVRILQLHRQNRAQPLQLSQQHDRRNQHLAGRAAGDNAGSRAVPHQRHGFDHRRIGVLVALHGVVVVGQRRRGVDQRIMPRQFRVFSQQRRQRVRMPAEIEEQVGVLFHCLDGAPAELALVGVGTEQIDREGNHRLVSLIPSPLSRSRRQTFSRIVR